MDKKPAHRVILDEIEGHFEALRILKQAKNCGELPLIERTTGLGGHMEMGAACALLDLLPLILIPETELDSVLVKLSEFSRKYRHCLIDGVIKKLTQTAVV